METYFQYQSQFTSGWLAGKKKHFILSAELRNRVKFGYPFFITPGDDPTFFEEHRLSFNGYLGRKFKSYPDKYPNFGAYLRAYTGTNPHGQFRNVPFYNFVGVALIILAILINKFHLPIYYTILLKMHFNTINLDSLIWLLRA